MTRQSFIVKGALAAGTVYGVATVAPFVSEAIAQEGAGDVEILNFALTLEHLEATFYEQGLKNVSGLGGEAKELATTLHENEAEHVDALTEAIKGLGGTPAKAPGVDFGEAFSSQKAFLKTAQTFEDLGVSAYNGAAPNIQSKEVLGSAGAIVQVEARHAAAIRQLNDNPITEAAFDKALEMQEVLSAVKPFVKS
ncbi:MAG: ferritin-like domain-containing protein [Actinomycetota bacterium]|nr:ferritin-like domain-containing protein [Actinomycetota bacterium]